MKAPTSSYGCFDLDCVACHGDEEWQQSRIACIYCGKPVEEFEDDSFLSLPELEDCLQVEDGRHIPLWLSESMTLEKDRNEKNL